MALTAQEKYDIVYYLGWPGKTLIPNSTDYSKVIADRLENLNAQIEVIVRRLLERAKMLDTALTDAVCRLSAKRVDEIEMNSDELLQLRNERKKVLGELSSLVDVPYLKAGGGASVCI